jgi:hypothetical protein
MLLALLFAAIMAGPAVVRFGPHVLVQLSLLAGAMTFFAWRLLERIDH